MSLINLSVESIGVRHIVTGTNNMTGVLPTNGAPTYDRVRHVLEYPAEATTGAGLFVPTLLFTNIKDHAYCPQILLLAASGVFTYSVAVTSGFGDGDATTIDAPAHDAVIASGSGVTNLLLKPNIELLPGQGIRVLMNTASATHTAIVYFCLTMGDGGRMIS